MGSLGVFLLKNWKPAIVVVFLIVLGGYIHILKKSRDAWEDKYVDEAKTSAVLQANNVALESAIAKQNKEIDEMNAQLEHANKVLQQGKETRQKLVDDYEARMKKLLSGDTPKTCESAIEYLIEGAKEFKQ